MSFVLLVVRHCRTLIEIVKNFFCSVDVFELSVYCVQFILSCISLVCLALKRVSVVALVLNIKTIVTQRIPHLMSSVSCSLR